MQKRANMEEIYHVSRSTQKGSKFSRIFSIKGHQNQVSWFFRTLIFIIQYKRVGRNFSSRQILRHFGNLENFRKREKGQK